MRGAYHQHSRCSWQRGWARTGEGHGTTHVCITPCRACSQTTAWASMTSGRSMAALARRTRRRSVAATSTTPASATTSCAAHGARTTWSSFLPRETSGVSDGAVCAPALAKVAHVLYLVAAHVWRAAVLLSTSCRRAKTKRLTGVCVTKRLTVVRVAPMLVRHGVCRERGRYVQGLDCQGAGELSALLQGRGGASAGLWRGLLGRPRGPRAALTTPTPCCRADCRN